MHPILKSRLLAVVHRERRLQFWRRLAGAWAVAGLFGLVLNLPAAHGLPVPVRWLLVGLAGLAAALAVLRQPRPDPDWRNLARQIELRFPDLDGRLLTAVQQRSDAGEELGYLQYRLVAEALRHGRQNDWADIMPLKQLRLAQSVHWLALAFFVFALFELRPTAKHTSLARGPEPGVTVTPGDTALERGSTLVVLARFGGALPPSVDLVLGDSTANKRIPLIKSLADPMFGASVPEVASNFVYHIEYAGTRTRDFKVSVFEYPRLESADADLHFPEYTSQPLKHVVNTRRLTAVEGSRLDLALHLNKPVASARLVPKDKDVETLSLLPDKARPTAVLRQFPLESSQTYGLQLVDIEGRTNKVPAQFVFSALKNRPPEIRLASPRGDQRPSPLEEISFEGTVWDDFGVKAYGLGYTVAGHEPKTIELGQAVSAAEKHPFKYLLRLEDLGVQPDELISWFVWADDVGPDGQIRRTNGDLFFGEVRPFDEIFREGQGMEAQGQGGESGGQEGGETGRLAELQKQIISATWKLQQRPPRKAAEAPEPQSSILPSRDGRARTPLRAAATRYNRTLGAVHLTSSESLSGTPRLLGQVDPAPSSNSGLEVLPRLPNLRASAGLTNQDGTHTYAEDAVVVRDAQAQALEQAQTALENQQDSRATALWRAATKEMERALARLRAATNSPAELKDALAAEQAAYQALLRLQEHEYQVARSRNRNQQGGARSQQMQRQLEQLDLTQSEDRYETQREAQRPQPTQRREQLQVMNRLQELARRQQDLNDRLKELQTALQEARTQEEREEIQRRLKRLQEEEQQMLADVDEVRQRMDRPENQSQMADERRQLDQTRNEIQRAAEAAGQGAASQALAAGTRAQQQLQQARDQMRKENSSQFAEDLREMRSAARELARQQDRIQQQMGEDAAPDHKPLSDAPGQEPLPAQLARQKERMTNLVERATQVSQQAEEAEPLLSRQLYDTVRKFSQDSTKDVKDLQDDLISRGLMTRNLYEQLKESTDPDGVKLLDLTSDLANRHLLPQARQIGQRSQTGIENLKRGVERAAESVLGDDTEALRLAQQELDQLTQQLQREMAQAESGTNSTNLGIGDGTNEQTRASASSRVSAANTNGIAREQASAQTGDQGQRSSTEGQEDNQNEQASGQANQQSGQGSQAGQTSSGQPGDSTGAQADGDRSQVAQAGQRSGAARDGGRRAAAAGGDWANGGDTGGWNGNVGNYLNRFLTDGRLRTYGPLTGEDFVPWADRLRDVEEMLEDPALRNEVAVARERARLLRQDFKRDRKKPDWAVVQLQVMKPLVNVRDRIADELAHRESREALVPIDRDPVPDRYSDLVRRYYEGLGKEK